MKQKRASDLSNKNIIDIIEISGLYELITLKLKNNKISEIKELEELNNLTYLDLSSNKIKRN